ncbi:hypothetical protein CPLU01_04260 [Colletotrichum plurivorum]|uniref:Uncharacterized protein n=1 Tax=Colletotrichum plurivorum TaxID=2175906 RepID=A0A8H6KPX5_9PEZI|nr:hypothetical protein CPLU01_04260 [Colletotrichum plurivorum]
MDAEPRFEPLPTVAQAGENYNRIVAEVKKVNEWLREANSQLKNLLEGPSPRLDLLETGVRVSEEQYEEALRFQTNQEDPFESGSPYGVVNRTYTPEEMHQLQQRADNARRYLGECLADIEKIMKFENNCRMRLRELKGPSQQAKLELDEAQRRRLLPPEAPQHEAEQHEAPAPVASNPAAASQWLQYIGNPAGVLSSSAPNQEQEPLATKKEESP